ncbi:MAG: hypothetical protein WCA32_24175, partial [Chromatiaceae bacterium]
LDDYQVLFRASMGWASHMARPLRIEFAGALYHVTSRGDGREATYLQDQDHHAWLEVLGHVCERFYWVVHAWQQGTDVGYPLPLISSIDQWAGSPLRFFKPQLGPCALGSANARLMQSRNRAAVSIAASARSRGTTAFDPVS